MVSAGQTVAWPNDDRIDHNVYSFSAPNAFDLGLYPQGEERRITLAQPGVLRVHCSIHRSMNAVILVAPTPLWAVVDDAGAFRIPQVPPGRYTLTIWSDVLPARTQTLDVHPEASTAVRLPLTD